MNDYVNDHGEAPAVPEETTAAQELEAMDAAWSALCDLDAAALERALWWLGRRLRGRYASEEPF